MIKRRYCMVPLVALGLCVALPSLQAKVIGWMYVAWPYAYSAVEGEWYYMNQADIQWSVRTVDESWGLLGHSPWATPNGWSSFDYPHVYTRDQWFYLTENNSMWMYNLTTRQWSTLAIVHTDQFRAHVDDALGTQGAQAAAALVADLLPVGSYFVNSDGVFRQVTDLDVTDDDEFQNWIIGDGHAPPDYITHSFYSSDPYRELHVLVGL